jgi:hypothetical protein
LLKRELPFFKNRCPRKRGFFYPFIGKLFIFPYFRLVLLFFSFEGIVFFEPFKVFGDFVPFLGEILSKSRVRRALFQRKWVGQKEKAFIEMSQSRI